MSIFSKKEEPAVVVHPEGCACGCDDLEAEDYVKEAEEARLKNDCMKREFSQCDCPLCKEANMSEEAKTEKSLFDKGLEYVDDGLKIAGKATGKAAWFFLKPLDQLHKHVIEPFTDSFKKEFTNSK